MKIGLGVWDLTIHGGTQRQLLELAVHLTRAGHGVTIYCCYLNRATCYPELTAGLDIRALHDGVAHVATASSMSNPAARLVYYARRYREQASFSRRLADLVDPDTALFNAHDHNAGWLGWAVKRRLGIPTVWMVNDVPRSFFPRSAPAVARIGRALLSWNVNLAERRVARSFDRIAVLDGRNRDLVRSAAGADAVIVRSGVDIAGLPHRQRSGIAPGGAVALLCVGAFFPWRRYEDAVAAVALLRRRGRDARLLIVGSRTRAAGYAAAIERLAAARGVADRVTIEGEVSERRLRDAFAAADIFLFPAHHQTWGLTVFEAMAAGLPTVVSRGAGAHEVLTHGETAMLVEPRRPGELAAAIEALAADPSLFAGLSARGRTFVETTLSWERYAAQMLALFSALAP